MPSDLKLSDLNLSDADAALAIEQGTIEVAPGVLALPMRRGGRSRNHPAGPKVGTVEGWALISAEDGHLGEHYWSIDTPGYPRRRLADQRGVRLSREIMGLTFGDEMTVDHINRERLDNRRENLRVVTQAENSQNTPARRGASSRFKGVGYQKKCRKWQAFGCLNYKIVHLGLFDREEDAAAAARKWRRLNHPFSID